MSGATYVGDIVPGWIMQLLNFGMAYPKGDEDQLFALGDAWKQAAQQLKALEPDIKSAASKVPQYYTGDGSNAIVTQLNQLLGDGDYSIQKLAKDLDDLGHDARSTATLIEYTKIQEEVFALLTMYTIFQLGSTVAGSLLIPAYKILAREAMAVFAGTMERKIAAIAAKAALKDLAKSLVRNAGAPLADNLASREAAKIAAREVAKKAALGGGMMTVAGGGLDAIIQGGQIMAGRRDDGFDLKQTFQTGIEWGVGGAVGAPAHIKFGQMLNGHNVSPLMKGLISGSAGGAVGGLGMYGAGLGNQIYNHIQDPNEKIDWTLHPQLLIAGGIMGGVGGMRHETRAHAATDGSTARGTGAEPAENRASVRSQEPGGTHNGTLAHENNGQGTRAELGTSSGEKATVGSGQTGENQGGAQQVVGGAQPAAGSHSGATHSNGSHTGANEPSGAGREPVKAADGASGKPTETGSRPASGDSSPRAGISSERTAETNAPRETGQNRQPADTGARNAGGATGSDRSTSIAAGASEKGAAAARGPEVKPANPPGERPSATQPVRVPAEPATPVQEPAAPRNNPSAPASDPAPVPRTPGEPANPTPAQSGSHPNRGTGEPPASRTQEQIPADSTGRLAEESPSKPGSKTPAEEGNPNGRAEVPETGRETPQADPSGVFPFPEPVESGRPGEASPRNLDPNRGNASDLGSFRGDARPRDQAPLTHDEMVHEVGENISAIKPREEPTAPAGEHEPVSWRPEESKFVLDDRIDVKVKVGEVEPGKVAEFVKRSETEYEVIVSERARTEDVARAVAHEVAEIRLEQDPAVLRDPVSERPDRMTSHLGGRFAELKVLEAQLERATSEPVRPQEAARLRTEIAEVLDELGMRDPATKETPQRLLREYDPELAGRIEQKTPTLTRETTEHPPQREESGPVQSDESPTRPTENESEPAWVSSEDPSLTLTHEQNRAADEFLQNSRNNEPEITNAMQHMASETSARMEGLEYRLKDEESFKRKFATELPKSGDDIAVALSKMKDSVRYTATWETHEYTERVRAAEQKLLDQGYEPVKRKPTWGDEGYRGFNSFWKDPKTGQVFEVQFHTPESFDAKMRTHDIYDQIRILPEGDPRRIALEAEQNAIFDAVPHPPGAETLSNPHGSGHESAPSASHEHVQENSTPREENDPPPHTDDATTTARPTEHDTEPAWVSSENPNITLNHEQNRAAEEFLARSAENEPKITDAMGRMASETGSRMEGLEYRLKDEDSFKRKFAAELEEVSGDIEPALANMKDSVRYTATWETNHYTENVRAAEQYLREQGYEPVKRKPSWNDEGYRGFNSFWRDSETGQVFEVQFHTPESFDAKMRTHHFYDEIRILPKDDPRRAVLEAEQNAIFDTVPHPPGAETLNVAPGPKTTAPAPAEHSTPRPDPETTEKPSPGDSRAQRTADGPGKPSPETHEPIPGHESEGKPSITGHDIESNRVDVPTTEQSAHEAKPVSEIPGQKSEQEVDAATGRHSDTETHTPGEGVGEPSSHEKMPDFSEKPREPQKEDGRPNDGSPAEQPVQQGYQETEATPIADGATDKSSPTPPSDPLPQPLTDYHGNFNHDAKAVIDALNGAGRPDLAQKFVDLVNREVNGDNVGGLNEWMGETVPRVLKSDVDKVLDKAAELVELDRLSHEIASDPELSVRFNPGDLAAKSFDILIERTTNGEKTPVRRVEVERMKDNPEAFSQLTGPSLHGADKAETPMPSRIPTAESTVVMPATPENGYTVQLGSNERRIGADGFSYQIFDAQGQERTSGNFLNELANRFNKDKNGTVHPYLKNLDAVNFVDENGNLRGRIVRRSTGWEPEGQ